MSVHLTNLYLAGCSLGPGLRGQWEERAGPCHSTAMCKQGWEGTVRGAGVARIGSQKEGARKEVRGQSPSSAFPYLAYHLDLLPLLFPLPPSCHAKSSTSHPHPHPLHFLLICSPNIKTITLLCCDAFLCSQECHYLEELSSF